MSYDILMVSDLRMTGESTEHLAAEIRALAAAGYRIAVLHVDSGRRPVERGVARPVLRCVDEGLATLTLGGDEISARNLVVRDPAVVPRFGRGMPGVTAESVVVVGPDPADAEAVADAVTRCFGGRPRWVSADAATRTALQVFGPPSGKPGATSPATPPENERVLFVSSNGTGMGHLTRLLAMARRSSDTIDPLFFSLSSAVPVVGQFGYPWEYCPSQDDLDISGWHWNTLFADRLAEVLRRYRPGAVVFDGAWPYNAFGDVRRIFADVLFVWSRRPMWRPDHAGEQLGRSPWFDLVIEPGEFAGEADRGPTVGRKDARKVGPITLLDHADLLDRAAAREALGIGFDEKALLVTLGAGNLNDLTSDLDIIGDVVGARPGWQVYATKAPIARGGGAARHDVRTVSVYPLARYLAAFDVAVVASGYNAYHESIMAGLPTIFVPKAKETDSQEARARYAAEVGVGLCVEEVTEPAISGALDVLLDPGRAKRMSERCRELYPANGAADAMRLVEERLAATGSRR